MAWELIKIYHESAVGMLEGGVGAQGRVVRLNDSSRHLKVSIASVTISDSPDVYTRSIIKVKLIINSSR